MEKNKTIAVRLNVYEYEYIKSLADENGRSISNMVRELINKEKEKDNAK